MNIILWYNIITYLYMLELKKTDKKQVFNKLLFKEKRI